MKVQYLPPKPQAHAARFSDLKGGDPFYAEEQFGDKLFIKLDEKLVRSLRTDVTAFDPEDGKGVVVDDSWRIRKFYGRIVEEQRKG